MINEDIIRIAREAGFDSHDMTNNFTCNLENIKLFVNFVSDGERQRLYKKFMDMHESQKHRNNYWHFAARKILEEIDNV